MNVYEGEFMTKSDITGLSYNDDEMVFFRNYIQSAHYIQWGAKLWDIFTDSQCKLVFVFSKEDHMKFRDMWGKRKNEYIEEVV